MPQQALSRVSSALPRRCYPACLAWIAVAVLWNLGGLGIDPRPQPRADESADATDESGSAEDESDSGIGFPTDRLRERQLDRARRLIADERWNDAAALFDEILAAGQDCFFRADRRQQTWHSIKTETNRVIGGLEKSGREAYELQFRARADRQLEQAVAANDSAGIAAVARRWFHTPAGYRATLLAAIDALETNQPLAAAAWLDRLSSVAAADTFEPTLSIMRATAWMRAGDRATANAILEKARTNGRNVARIAGQDVTLSFPLGGGLKWLFGLVGEAKSRTGRQAADWEMHRGNPSRNGVTTASCPLLAARYRVPLARHPEESRLLDTQRRLRTDREIAALPAGSPLAVDGTILMRTSIGLLAVDFETGKRVWLQTGSGAGPRLPTAAEEDPTAETEAGDSFNRTFEDATSGTLASDGRLVFVVESHPDALIPRQAGGLNFRLALPPAGGAPPATAGWRGGNTLSAYEVANRGRLRWRLPERPAGDDDAGRAAPAVAWYLGAPLPVGDQLFVLVEEKGEIRLDVVEAATGRLSWSQPFAEVDERWAVDQTDNHARRLAGLSPALAESVLVCPTGAGAVVAIDLATRTLLWAHEYPRAPEAEAAFQIGRMPRAEGAPEPRPGRWLDSAPILAGGRVLLAASDSQELLCIDLRRGEAVWRQPRRDRLYVAGVVEGRAIVVGRRGVEALDLTSGRLLWNCPLGIEQGSTSGRGMLTENRFFLPLDTPEVLEIDLTDGKIVGRSAARGNAVPGNLVAYRGEVISQGTDCLEVYHQAAALEPRIETALEADPRDAWAILWRGQLRLDRGDVGRGVADVRAAHTLQPARATAAIVAGALLFALHRDFAQASPLWREAVALSGSPETAVAVLRATVDGFLSTGDLPQAWEAVVRLLDFENAAQTDWGAEHREPGSVAAPGLIADGSDPHLSVAQSRWTQGRIATIRSRATPDLRATLDAFMAGEAARAADGDRVAGLRRFVERFGRADQAIAGRRKLADAIDEAIEGGASDDERRSLAVERDFVLLELARVGGPADRDHAAAALAAIRRGFSGMPDGHGAQIAPTEPGASSDGAATAWPLGRILARRSGRDTRPDGPRREAEEGRFLRPRLTSIPVGNSPDSFLPGLELAFDSHQQTGLLATDGYGRPIGEPFWLRSRPDANRPIPPLHGIDPEEALIVGRALFIRVGKSIVAIEMTGAGQGRGTPRPLWVVVDKSDPTAEIRPAGFIMNAGGGKVGRQGNAPLGARISEPRPADEFGNRGMMLAGVARCTGVAVLADRSLKVYDPLTGRPLWERQQLPAGSELIGDDDHLCVCPPDGRNAVVLAMADGRVVRTTDLPATEQRLLTSGCSILAVIATAANHDATQRVRLDVFDAVTGRSRSLGDYPGESRAAGAGDGRLAVVEPTGALSLLDIGTARVVFHTRLPEMPPGLEQVQVLPWMDRYLVFVGRHETPEEKQQLDRIGAVAPLMGMQGRQMPHLFTGSVWAVDASSGDMLWPVPATLLRHGIQGQAGSQLPVLLCARLIQPEREPERQHLSILCLDKRTGQAVYLDDRFNGRSGRPDVGIGGCSISGDPAGHTIALSQGRRDSPDVQLEFSGAPTAPRPPFQASAAHAMPPTDPLSEIEYWIKRVLTLPLPF